MKPSEKIAVTTLVLALLAPVVSVAAIAAMFRFTAWAVGLELGSSMRFVAGALGLALGVCGFFLMIEAGHRAMRNTKEGR